MDSARFVTIKGDLGAQRVDAVELGFRAKKLNQFRPQRHAVEIFRKIEQVNFEDHAFAAKCRPAAKIGDAQQRFLITFAPRLNCVNTELGDQMFAEIEIGRRETDLGAAFLAGLNNALDHPGTTEQRRSIKRPGGMERVPDRTCRKYQTTIICGRIDHRDAKSVLLGDTLQHVDISAAILTENEIVADNDMARL